ncbi:bifunctional hydroxymethylpyrimidine kinase/phosphomethylpyrimidine kinase [Candidatus Poribacteria bacterium]|nr:bifunctional hydroxymethylpyrimidine kinase/phosphomethylpyrimidine kinase [Candidatus Poribacteria bacterium]
MIKKALTIAGSDSGGGAGIQADLKTFAAFGVYGTSVITSVTAQNTMGVRGVYDLPSEFVALQIDSILTDIGADAVKTGMLPNSQIIELVCEKIKVYHLSKLVVDPVMISTSGHRFISAEAVRILIEKLIPLAYIVTPNLSEAEMIAEIKIATTRDMELAAQKIKDKGATNVVVKGGHLSGDAIDVLFDGRAFFYYGSERVQTKNTHGTGCTFSAAITAELAKGNDLQAAVKIAKDYITNAIRYSYNIGSGHGPVNHFHA